MGRFATGVTVISSAAEGEVRCMTANAFMSGSLDPALCVISVARRARMHGFLERAGHFGVSVLAEDQQACSLHFSGRSIPGFEPAFEYAGSTPILLERVAAIAARVVSVFPCGDHSLFCGEIFHMAAEGDEKPLVFYAGRYGRLEPARVSLPTPEFW